jgi:NitT/TauT family transport system substrate-binding protein
VFAAPPLLAGKMRAGEFDATLIYWHFAARLEAAGLVQLHDVEDAMLGLGIKPPPPLIGFVYRDPADDAARKAFDGFRASIHDAARLLVESDEEWQRLRPLLKAGTEAEFIKLRDRFRDGQLKAWTAAEVEGARKLFELLAEAGGDEIVGAGVTFDAALFDGIERP